MSDPEEEAETESEAIARIARHAVEARRRKELRHRFLAFAGVLVLAALGALLGSLIGAALYDPPEPGCILCTTSGRGWDIALGALIGGVIGLWVGIAAAVLVRNR